MAEFVYNNAKNTSTGYISFKLNCKFYLQVFYKKDIVFCLKLKVANKSLVKL